jgi:hypothetical protein
MESIVMPRARRTWAAHPERRDKAGNARKTSQIFTAAHENVDDRRIIQPCLSSFQVQQRGPREP